MIAKDENTSIHIIAHGRVQGVFFRKSTAEKANALNLKGTVQNLTDGTVEIYAQGPFGDIMSLVDWCKIGSPKANVTKLDYQFVEANAFDTFQII